MASLPSDLVRDQEFITTLCDGVVTIHEFLEAGDVPSQREVHRREIWFRDHLHPVGVGGFGRIYRETLEAHDMDISPQYRAVKQIRLPNRGRDRMGPPGRDAQTRELYTRELEAIMKFSLPKYQRCFVTAHGWFQSWPDLYIAMEYFPLGDLSRNISRRKLRVSESRTIAGQLLEGLRFMHSEGFAHRDLKPQNILVRAAPPDPWWVKIGDFGISKRIISGEAPQGLTFVVGTHGYAAPELERRGLGAQTSHSFNYEVADMWSLGVILYQMLGRTGEFPVPDVDKTTLRRGTSSILSRDVIPQEALDLVYLCLRQNPSRRITSSRAIKHKWITTTAAQQAQQIVRAPPNPVSTQRQRPEPQRHPNAVPPAPAHFRFELHPPDGGTASRMGNQDTIQPAGPLPQSQSWGSSITMPPAGPNYASAGQARSQPPNRHQSTSEPGHPIQPSTDHSSQTPAVSSDRTIPATPLPENPIHSKTSRLRRSILPSKNVFASCQEQAAFGRLDQMIRVRTLHSHVGGVSKLTKEVPDASNPEMTGSTSAMQSTLSLTSGPRSWTSHSKNGRHQKVMRRGADMSSTPRLTKQHPAIVRTPRSDPGRHSVYNGIPVATTLSTSHLVARIDVTRVLISLDSKLLVTIARPSRVGVWEASTGRELLSKDVPDINPYSCLLMPSAQHLLFEMVGSGSIILWDIASKKPSQGLVASPRPNLGPAYSLAKQCFNLSPSGSSLAVFQLWEKAEAFGETYKAYVTFFDMHVLQSLGSIDVPATFSKGRSVPTRNAAPTTNFDTVSPLPTDGPLGSAPDFHFAVVFTFDERHVVLTVQADVFLLDVSGTKTPTSLLRRSDQLLGFVTPVAQRLVFSSIVRQEGEYPAGKVVIWDMANPTRALELTHPFNVLGCVISKDGQVAICIAEGWVVLWDIPTGNQLLRTSTGSPILSHLAPCELAPDGSLLTTYHADGVRVWEIPEKDIERTRQSGGRNWSPMMFRSEDGIVTDEVAQCGSQIAEIPEYWQLNTVATAASFPAPEQTRPPGGQIPRFHVRDPTHVPGLTPVFKENLAHSSRC